MLKNKEIMLAQNEARTFRKYDVSNKITISYENQEQREEVLKLLKRQFNPVKSIILDALIAGINWECPLCGKQVVSDTESRDKYCSECGCKFDWSEIDTRSEA